MINIPFFDLKREVEHHHEEYIQKISSVLKSGSFVLGEEVASFEKNFADFNGMNYCVSLNSGYDALKLSLLALGIVNGDEIIVSSHTFVATVFSIIEVGAIPILIDTGNDYNINTNLIEEKITRKTKAILIVHLYGIPCELERIVEIANKFNLNLIEDCAQSHGARYKNRLVGSFSDVSCFSFYPTKNLGAFGDAGACLTNSYDIYNKIKMLRNYGSNVKYVHEMLGFNSRMDEIQAAILNLKLLRLPVSILRKNEICNLYLKYINNPKIKLPKVSPYVQPSWHLFVIEVDNRESFQKYMTNNGIETVIHYPNPIHRINSLNDSLELKRTEFLSDHVVSLPLFDSMNESEILTIIEAINNYG
jgi:dTDP-4-amino-4,6-dideoxygalactose transaminase